MAERVAVGLLDRRADRRADVGEEQTRTNVAGKLAQVQVIPRRFNAAEQPGGRGGVVPADAETVAVGCLGSQPGVQALVDQ
jgi:hypothetical protein